MRFLDCLSLVKFLGFMATLVKTVGSNSSSNEGSQTTNTNEKELTKPLDSCSLIIVSTLDGKLSALDARQDGALRWSLPSLSGPLLSSSLSSLQNGKQVRVIPSLDGGLYQVNGEKIEPIPYTADNLLGSFYKLQDGSMLVGGKEAISCGIDPKTGKVKYVCSAEGCKLTDHDSEEHVQDSDIFVVKRTKQTVRAVDQRTGSESWNFSVGQQDVTFLDSLTNDADTKCPMEDREETVEWKLRVSIPEGLIAAVKLHDLASVASDIVLWSHKFESPINAVWMLHGSYLKSVDLFSDDVLPGLRDGLPNEGSRDRPIMYLGSHEGQVYIQHSHNSLNPSLDSAIRMQSKGNHDVGRKPRAITWQPKLATSASRTPTVVSKEIAIWNPVEYPFDNGYFFFGNVQPFVPPHKGRIENVDEVNKTLNKTNQGDGGQANQSSLAMEYWKGAIFVVVVLAAIAHYLFRFLLPKRQQTPELQRLPSASTSIIQSASEPTMQREQSITSITSSSSMSSIFVSRYAADFEHELCLGKGGFGVVFQARNKVDDCQYAIKRVRLPNCDEAREKVMREVKALAKLEHPCIVRYFNAWFEAPPVGWQEENDITYLGDRTCTDLNLDSEESSKHPCQSNGDLHNPDMIIRRRKKTSSSKSKHSSSSCSDIANDGRHATLTATDEDLSLSFDVHQLENEAFLPETDASGSFGVEFVDSSKSGSGLKGLSHQHDDADADADDDDDLTDSDDGIIFTSHLSNGEEHAVVDPLLSKSSKSSSCKSLSPSFTTSGQSLLSGKNHKCKSEKCTQDTIQAPLYLFIQMQLCRRESLKDWLKNNSERDHSSCLHVFDQIVNAVEYFHGRGMMHRDLKPSNIFFSMDGSVKVGDFGLVTASVQEPTDNPTKGKNGFIDANHTGQVGTHLYMSPEQIEGKAYSYKVDVFSLGLIFFELFHTFCTEMERIKVMIDVKRKAIPEEFKAKMALQAQLVKWMLSESPKNRPSAPEIRTSEVYRRIIEDIGLTSKLNGHTE